MTVVTFSYATAAELKRDLLPDVPRGIMGRTLSRVREGELTGVRIQVAKEKVSLELRGRVRWVTPLGTGALAGLELEALSESDEEKLDSLLGSKGTSSAASPSPTPQPTAAASGLPRLSVAMLEPIRVLREVLTNALTRFAGEGEGWDLQLDAVSTVDAFMTAMNERRRDLAILDCDGIGAPVDPLVDAIRFQPSYAKLPIIILSRSRSARLEDSFTVTMQKPVAMKALLHTTGILLRG